MVRPALPLVVAVVSMAGCFDLLGQSHSDKGGTFTLHDGIRMQVYVDEGEETNWTWSSTSIVSFTVKEFWIDGSNETLRIAHNLTSDRDAGRFTASRSSELWFIWSNPSPGNPVNVTYFLRTEGYHQTIHY